MTSRNVAGFEQLSRSIDWRLVVVQSSIRKVVTRNLKHFGMITVLQQ